MSILLVLLLIATLAYSIYLFYQLKDREKEISRLQEELQAQRSRFEKEVQKYIAQINALQNEIKALEKWKIIGDADAKASEMLHEAQSTLAKASEDASQLLAKTNQEVDTLLSDARKQARTMKEEAQSSLIVATTKATGIIDEAKERAKEIAGSAYEAMEKADYYKQAMQAMKNIIEGYGNQYLVPGRSLLDDLAADFGHKEAGRELKNAREYVKSMIKSGLAADCEYAEPNRRDTAIQFVIDAFNGKVDSILSRVRSDNAGILEQEIKDALSMVNLHGKAFRNAHITDEYLAARLNELKWAAVAQQLRIEEREEQRRIREQIREEEKARKEYERAIRDSAKEEEMLQKAVEKARLLMEKATTEQKVKYEQQLEELSQKLKEAEERSQRAVSMAQQTRQGHVYIISNTGSFGEHVYKIGLTRRLEPHDRIRELGDSSVPFSFDVHAMIFSEDAPALENTLHKHFITMQMNKVNHRKEFFRVDLTHIREEIENMGIAARWTMAAEAREYFESQAIERVIADDPIKREEWIQRQLRLDPIDIETPEAVDRE